MRNDRAGARSLLFSLIDGRLPNRYRMRIKLALELVSPELRKTLHDAHVRRVRPFPREAEEAAVDELRKALALLGTGTLRRRGLRRPGPAGDRSLVPSPLEAMSRSLPCRHSGRALRSLTRANQAPAAQSCRARGG